MQRLLYIASTGYSGSTLLEGLLGANRCCFNVGEACKLGWYRDCGCGVELDNCEFWAEVSAKLARRLGGERTLRQNHVNLAHGVRQGRSSYWHPFFIVLGKPMSHGLFSRFSREIGEYREGCRRALELFEEASEATGAKVIVDSSKDPVLLKHFYCLAPEKFRVIHLVRDARAVTWSLLKNVDRDGFTYPSEKTGRRPTLEEAARWWKARNRNIGLSLRGVPATQKLVLRYEDLCADPTKAATRIGDLLGMEINLPTEFTPSRQHSIAGNPMRRTSSSVVVRLNEEWRDQLGEVELAAIDKVAGRANRHFGYE